MVEIRSSTAADGLIIGTVGFYRPTVFPAGGPIRSRPLAKRYHHNPISPHTLTYAVVESATLLELTVTNAGGLPAFVVEARSGNPKVGVVVVVQNVARSRYRWLRVRKPDYRTLREKTRRGGSWDTVRTLISFFWHRFRWVGWHNPADCSTRSFDVQATGASWSLEWKISAQLSVRARFPLPAFDIRSASRSVFGLHLVFRVCSSKR